MRIWNALGRTDPAHTKQFTRAGGFKGTAIKPMWANKQMTEFFGPCGIGWGMNKPEFQTVEADGEILVYCTVGLWYIDGSLGGQNVYGVGGDKVVSQIFVKDQQGNKVRGEDGRFKTYPQTDDEAFKKAYTDALSNAMKFIGVAADVHMGQFDDNKYVQEVRAEFEEQKKTEVIAEVERQKGTSKASMVVAQPQPMNVASLQTSSIPPELESTKIPPSGVVFCRIKSVAIRKRKKGEGEYLTIQIHQPIGGKDLLTYFHNSYRDELKAAKDKVCKFMVVQNGDFLNLDLVLEIDGKKVALEPDPKETEARLLASVLGFEEEELRETFSTLAGGSWSVTLDKLKAEKAHRDAIEADSHQPA